MLKQLVINDLAVIDALNLDFKTGMTVLTGETGAGKSILLDALGLILGDRADSSIIRGEKEKTDITAIFSITNIPAVHSLLNEIEIDTDDELFIRRTISRDGRSRAYLNNTPVTIQKLRKIGEYLIDIHGQHAHQSLSRATTQRELLDQFGEYNSLINKVNMTYREWKDIVTTLKKMNTDDSDHEAKLTLLRYQIDELNQLEINATEYTKLSEEHKRLSHSQKLLDICQSALNDLSESENSVSSRLASHQQEVSALCSIDKVLENTSALLESASIQAEEASAELRDYINQFDTDISQLTELESRLDKLHELSRKHKVRPEELPEHLSFLTDQLHQLKGGQEQAEQLEQKKTELTKQYFRLAEELHKKRQQAASTISSGVTEKMHELGMGGKFNINVEAIEDDTLHSFGMDKISFMVSTNPGQPLRAITKVASGGELSRLSLAIQIIGSKDNGVPTMIFDEVDAGISGGIAEIVGKMLNSLAKQRQVLCVTHLAQVASCGHNHLQVSKNTRKNETFTQVIELNQQERVDEVARMLAGMKITNESRANAAQMLESV